MADPIQDSDLAKRNAAERKLILGARDSPTETKMPDGQTVADFQRDTYEAHLAEARAAEEVQIQRTREQSIANDPLYAQVTTGNETSSVAVVAANHGFDLTKEPVALTRESLMAKSKAELVAIAEGQGVTVVPDSQTRTEIVNAILAAQSV